MAETIYSIDALIVAAGLAALMLAGWAGGYVFGLQFHGGKIRASTKIDDASLAILGLLLAFTFAMAMTKHVTRREMVITDSNSIGDFYTCVCLLPDPPRGRLEAIVREYVQKRLLVASAEFDARDFESALQQMSAMQESMTDLVREAVYMSQTPASVATVLVQTLNGLTSAHAARLAAVKDRLPLTIVLLLFASSIVAAMIIGREQGISGDRHVTTVVGFIVLVCLVVWVTLDLNQPRRGMITVSQETMQRLLTSMQAPATGPAR